MCKLAGLGIIGLAVFLGAVVAEVTKKVHQSTSAKPGEAGILHR